MNSSNSNPSLITTSGVSQSVQLKKRRVEILKDASFTIEDGSFTVIHGPSGSGKTTLLNTLTGLVKPDTGSVKYLDKDIYNLSEAELAHFRAHTMGIVHQSNYWVKSLNALENVALPLYFLGYDKSNAEREAMESLRRVGMDKHHSTLPSLLSGGEQQRVSMARALVSNPNYIVADEPTGNLDSKNGNTIIALLRYFNTELKRTIILVTHNQDYLKYGTQVLSLKDGEVTQVDKPQPGPTPQPNPVKTTSPSSRPPAKFSSIAGKFKPIKLSVLSRIALANILAKRLRSSLTILGMGIGIGSIFLLLSFGLGLQNLVQEQIIGTDSVRVIDVTSANSEILKLDETSLERFYQIAHVDKIGSQYTSAGEFKLDQASSDAVVYGVDKELMELSNITLAAGKLIDPDASHEVMLNQSLLTSLGYDDINKVVGKELNLTLKLDSGDYMPERPFKITGVIDTGNSSTAVLYIPQAIYTNVEAIPYNHVKIVTNSQEHVDKVRQQLETFGYQTSSPLDTLEQVDKFFQFFNVILIGFGSVGMFIAIIGIFNTLTIALLERVREIGLMVALGARRRDVSRLFIAESLFMSLTGGLLGIALAIITGFIVNLSLNRLSAARGAMESFSIFATPIWLIAAALAFTAVVGLLVAYIPARRAGKINPIDALRRE